MSPFPKPSAYIEAISITDFGRIGFHDVKNGSLVDSSM